MRGVPRAGESEVVGTGRSLGWFIAIFSRITTQAQSQEAAIEPIDAEPDISARRYQQPLGSRIATDRLFLTKCSRHNVPDISGTAPVLTISGDSDQRVETPVLFESVAFASMPFTDIP